MTDTADGTSERAGAGRRAAGALGLVALVVAAVVGANLFGLRDDIFGSAAPKPRPAATSFRAIDSHGTRQRTSLRSQPWWQPVTDVSGRGPRAVQVPVGKDAIQWRAKWSCQGSHLTVQQAGQDKPLVDSACPRSGTATETGGGRASLAVTADAAWSLRVDQQVDVPLVQPPLPAMHDAATVATGSFYKIDQHGTGRATIYSLADGSHALRLAGFYVTPNVDLQVRFSALEAPHSTRQYTGAPSALVAPLPITAGSLNLRVPRGVDPRRWGSIVIWCPPVHSAYAAATLRFGS